MNERGGILLYMFGGGLELWHMNGSCSSSVQQIASRQTLSGFPIYSIHIFCPYRHVMINSEL